MAAEHGGTHIDAPIHFFEGAYTVDQIPLEKVIGETVVVDVTGACTEDPHYQFEVADLRPWETNHNRQLTDVIVFLRTGFGQRWHDRERYLARTRLANWQSQLCTFQDSIRKLRVGWSNIGLLRP